MGEGQRRGNRFGGRAVADPAGGDLGIALIALVSAPADRLMNWVARLPLMVKKPAFGSSTSLAAGDPSAGRAH